MHKIYLTAESHLVKPSAYAYTLRNRIEDYVIKQIGSKSSNPKALVGDQQLSVQVDDRIVKGVIVYAAITPFRTTVLLRLDEKYGLETMPRTGLDPYLQAGVDSGERLVGRGFIMITLTPDYSQSMQTCQAIVYAQHLTKDTVTTRGYQDAVIDEFRRFIGRPYAEARAQLAQSR